LLAYRTTAGAIRIWDCAARRLKASFEAPKAARVLLAFSPDKRLLATGTDDGVARVWDIATGQPTTDLLVGHFAGLTKVSLSADSRTLVTYCEDHTAKLWNVATGREMMSSIPLNNFLVFHPWWHLFPADGNSVLERAGARSIRFVRLLTLAEIDALERTALGEQAKRL
jgi:WD40 repeat protein